MAKDGKKCSPDIRVYVTRERHSFLTPGIFSRCSFTRDIIEPAYGKVKAFFRKKKGGHKDRPSLHLLSVYFL